MCTCVCVCVCFSLLSGLAFYIVVVANRLCNECKEFDVEGDAVTCDFCVKTAVLKKKKEELLAKRLEEKKKQEE